MQAATDFFEDKTVSFTGVREFLERRRAGVVH